MIALYIILAIIAFFVLLLSVRFRIETEYIDNFTVRIKWLFLNFTIYPLPPKKDKKAKKEKPQKEQTEKEIDEAVETVKKPNPFKKFYDNQGYEGVIQLIKDTSDALGTLGKGFKKHFIITDLYLWLVISKNQDAAATAIEYGNVCKDVFPAMGLVCSTMKVKKYDVSIEPDFIGTFSSGQFVANFSLRPIFLINSGLMFVLRFLFKVVFKVLRIKSKDESPENNKDLQNIKGGATQ